MMELIYFIACIFLMAIPGCTLKLLGIIESINCLSSKILAPIALIAFLLITEYSPFVGYIMAIIICIIGIAFIQGGILNESGR